MKNSSPFEDLLPGIRALCEGITDEIALMATLSCELFHGDGRCDWVGFYRVTAPEMLTIGPYQGGHGCLLIPFDKGVCGAAARTGTTQLVDDVNAFEGHIACSSSTLSEIVVPLFNGQGEVFAVLDIDSDQPAAFDKADQAILEGLVAELFAHV